MRLLPIALLAACIPAAANTLPLQPVTIDYRASYLQFKIPGEPKDLGLFGVSALAKINDWLYGGVTTYGAVKGDNSGFFAFGLAGDIQHPIVGPLWGDVGGFIGSGGGSGLASSIGNGGFYEAHAGLQYDIKVGRVGLNASHIGFFDADIDDNQLTVSYDLPVELALTSAENAGSRLYHLNDFSPVPTSSNMNSIGVVTEVYLPHKGTKDQNGALMDGHAGLVGFEFGHYFSPYVGMYLKALGAVTGNKNGFAAGLGGLSLSTQQQYPVALIGKLGLGSGGGGNVDTGSGLIIQPEMGALLNLTPHIDIQALGGYLWAPSSGYRAVTAGLHLDYKFDVLGLEPSSQTLADSVNASKWRLRLGGQAYLDAQRENASDNGKDVQLLAMKFDYFLCKPLYLTGQTAFAYTGNAAGYFSGMIGAGLQSPTWHHVYAYGEILGGAAGGAGFEIGTGKMIEPLVGLGVHFNRQFGAYASVGRTYSPGNNLSTNTIDLGLSWRFGLLN